ncbi:MAG: hypothetical protein ACHQEM_05985 [Chitinophagales bacterium]
MNRHSTIRPLLGLLLLFVFGFSTLPKKTVHDLFARHKDSNSRVNDSKSMQFSWAGFHCNCENLVVESPFIHNHFDAAIASLPSYPIQFAAPLVSLHAKHLDDLNLRGPPAA